ncbi:MAG: hypothetical protein WCE48_11770 [Steroidobacteraceae bacterium]
MTHLSSHRTEAAGRFRRGVALLALTAWTLSGFFCPMPDHGIDTVPAQQHTAALSGQMHEHGNSPNQLDPDLCCQLLSGAHAIAQALAIPTTGKAWKPSFAIATVAVSSSLPEASRSARLLPFSHGPPENLYRRFATFWSHAPPADPA